MVVHNHKPKRHARKLTCVSACLTPSAAHLCERPAGAMSSPQSKNDSSLAPRRTCGRTVAWEDRGIVCKTCGQWFYSSCQGIGHRSYIDLGASNINCYCEVSGNPNCISVAFDLHGIDQLESVFSCTPSFTHDINQSFTPFHISAPTLQS